MSAVVLMLAPRGTLAATLAATLDAAGDWLVRTSWQAAVLVALVVALQVVLGNRLDPRWRFALWMLIVVRLLMPVVPQSPWSVFNLRFGETAKTVTTRVPSPPTEVGEPAETGNAPGGAVHVSVRIVGSPELLDLPPVRTAQRPTHARFDWRAALLIAWLAGAAVMLARTSIGTIAMRHRLRTAHRPQPETLALLEACRREMGLRSVPPTLITDAVRGPALFGFFRPTLLVPPRLIDLLTREELRFVLLHELAHHARRDPLTNALLVLAGAVHWFNPLARWALARCRAEREMACDAMVMGAVALAADTSDARDRNDAAFAPAAGGAAYGRAVLRVAETFNSSSSSSSSSSAHRVPVAAVGMIHTRSQLRRRIAMIATYTPASRGTRRVRLVPLLLVFGLASCALTDGAEEKPSASASASPSPSTRPAAAQSPGSAADPFAGATPGFAPPSAEPRGNQTAEADLSREERAIRAILDRTLPEFNFSATPLTDVVDHLRDVTRLNIFVDWVALEAAGIDRVTPVTARLRDVKFSKAIQILLDQVGGGNVKLGYTFDGNVMTVSTADVLGRQTITKVYDIRDLIIDIPDFTDAPDVGDVRPIQNVAGAQSMPEPKPKPQTRPADASRSRAELIESITTLTRETVDPDSWRDNGGTVGAIRELHGQLIITQTQDNHRAIVRLLEQLRETRAIQVIVVTRYITVDPSKLPEAVRRKLDRGVDGPGDAVSQLFTEEEESALLQAVQAVPGATVVTAPRISLFNGQRAYVRTAYSQAYVSGYRRTAGGGEGGQARYEPERSEVSSGVLVDVAATASADRKHVRLNFHPKFATVRNVSKTPWVGPPDAPKDLMVEVPHVDSQEIQTIVMVPDRHAMVMAGLGAKAREDEDAAAAGQRHYVLVKPTLIGGK